MTRTRTEEGESVAFGVQPDQIVLVVLSLLHSTVRSEEAFWNDEREGKWEGGERDRKRSR